MQLLCEVNSYTVCESRNSWVTWNTVHFDTIILVSIRNVLERCFWIIRELEQLEIGTTASLWWIELKIEVQVIQHWLEHLLRERLRRWQNLYSDRWMMFSLPFWLDIKSFLNAQLIEEKIKFCTADLFIGANLVVVKNLKLY